MSTRPNTPCPDARLCRCGREGGGPVLFWVDGWHAGPTSRAVQASATLPALYPPVEVRGRHLVDGALRRTLHASVLLERDIDLLLGINPLVPFHAGLGAARGGSPVDEANDGPRLVHGGPPAVLSPTFRPLPQ